MCLAGLLWFREPAAGGYLPSVGAFAAGAAGPGYLVDGPLYLFLQVRCPIHHVVGGRARTPTVRTNRVIGDETGIVSRCAADLRYFGAPTGAGQSPTARSLASAYWS